jgi:hypothetical protein
MKGESKGAYQAFVDTALFGLSQRQLLEKYEQQVVSESLTRPPTLSGKTIARWSVDFKWQERLPVWRSHFHQLKTNQRLEKWGEFCDVMITKASDLVDRADQLMKHPAVERKVTKTVTAEYAGQEIDQEITIKPARWTARDIPMYYDEAAKLMRVSVGDLNIAIDLVTKQGYIVSEPAEENDGSEE